MMISGQYKREGQRAVGRSIKFYLQMNNRCWGEPMQFLRDMGMDTRTNTHTYTKSVLFVLKSTKHNNRKLGLNQLSKDQFVIKTLQFLGPLYQTIHLLISCFFLSWFFPSLFLACFSSSLSYFGLFDQALYLHEGKQNPPNFIRGETCFMSWEYYKSPSW